MGCGKSSIGRPLAKRLGLKFVDMDTEIERRCGVSVQQFFADRGEEAFRRLERELLRELTSAEDTVVATGGGVPCFFDNMELMNGAGVTVYFKLAPEKHGSNTARQSVRCCAESRSRSWSNISVRTSSGASRFIRVHG